MIAIGLGVTYYRYVDYYMQAKSSKYRLMSSTIYDQTEYVHRKLTARVRELVPPVSCFSFTILHQWTLTQVHLELDDTHRFK